MSYSPPCRYIQLQCAVCHIWSCWHELESRKDDFPKSRVSQRASVQHPNSNSIGSNVQSNSYTAQDVVIFSISSRVSPQKETKRNTVKPELFFRPLGNLEALLLAWLQHGPPGILRWIRCCSHGHSTDLKEPGKIRFLGKKTAFRWFFWWETGNL